MPTSRPGRAWLLSLFGFLVLAIWLYTPYAVRPYDVMDFFDYLPILRGSNSTLDAVSTMTRHYAEQGRFNPAAFAAVGLKWRLFGEDMLGWQIVRFAQMTILSVLTFSLLRRLELGRLGSLGGALIYFASPPAAVVWMRMNTGEPSGTILLVIFMLLMLRWSDQTVPPRGLVTIAATVVGIGLFKEFLLLALIVPGIVLTLLTSPGRALSLRTLYRSRRLLAAGLGGLLVALPVILVAMNAPPTAYSRGFGAGSFSAASVLLPALATLFPFAPADGEGGALLLLAVCAYILLLVAGWGLVLRGENRTRRSWLLLTMGLGLPFSGAIAYAAWPTYALMYALPFQVGTAVLVATAITAIEHFVPRARPMILASGALILIMMVSAAHRYARFVDRSLTMTRELAVYVGSLDPTVPVRFEACPGLQTDLWSNYGEIVGRYATSLNLAHPRVLDARCDIRDSVAVVASHAPLIVLSDTLVARPSPFQHRRYAWRTIDWRAMRVRERGFVVSMPASSQQ